MPVSPEILLEQPNLALAYYGSVAVAIPRGESTFQLVTTIRGALTKLADRTGDAGFGLLFVVAEASTPPDGPARQAAKEMFAALQSRLRALSAQLEGSGFLAAAKRSVFTWATTRQLEGAAIKTFSELPPATDWLIDKCAGLKIASPSSQELQTLVRGLHTPKSRA